MNSCDSQSFLARAKFSKRIIIMKTFPRSQAACTFWTDQKLLPAPVKFLIWPKVVSALLHANISSLITLPCLLEWPTSTTTRGSEESNFCHRARTWTFAFSTFMSCCRYYGNSRSKITWRSAARDCVTGCSNQSMGLYLSFQPSMMHGRLRFLSVFWCDTFPEGKKVAIT